MAVSMNYVVDSAEYETHWSTMLLDISIICTALSLYALYVVLFLLSIPSLHRRIPNRKIILVTAWTMFLFATSSTLLASIATATSMSVVYMLVQGSNNAPTHLIRLYHALILAQDIILALNKLVHVPADPLNPRLTDEIPSLVTDLLFLFRCYIIWGSRKRILVLPGILIVANMVVGCIAGLEWHYGLITLSSYVDPRVPVGMAGATNVLLTCLTAGRIWYIRRKVQTLTGWQASQKRYNTASAIILESGVLYTLCVITYIISCSVKIASPFGTIFQGVAWGLVQLGVNIVPTFILVRVGMGRSTENSPSGSVTLDRNIKC
ncbi:hypothetical protein GGX14DRAFT_637664 [Mycena pura]|uniref:Uncharacterized protein n=1 Tax=Mycena pura TaxID=153505 RepID=A0AAD6V9L0_9AGAR|nr:hypothetical protein GGX14DRAFT_637664 [Mycena pura]